MNNKKTFLLLFLILIFTFILYSPVINYDFLRCWDDYIYTIENQIVKEGMSLINIGRIFGSFLLGNYHPLTLLSYTFDYSIFGFQPQYFHLVNLLLHLMNCLFVFVLIYRVSKRSGIALITTLIFAIHPLRIEPVAWISGRKDLLAAMFAFLSLIAYTYYQKQRKLNVYILCLVAFILSLLSKAMVLGLPAMLFLIDYLNKKHLVFDRWFEKIPFFIVSIGFGIIAWIARQTYQYQLSENVLGVGYKVLIAAHRFVFYFILRQFLPFWPSLLQPYVSNNLPVPFAYYAVFSIVITIFIGLILIILRRNRNLVFGAMFYLVGIAPVLLVVTLGYSADRFTYFASPGLAFLFILLFVHIYNKIKEHSILRNSTIAFGSVLILYFLVLTMSYLPIWKSCLSLTSYVIDRYPRDPAAYLNRGLVYQERGEYEKAKQDFAQALKINPNYVDASRRIGEIFYELKNADSAFCYYQRTIRTDPNNAEALFLLGNLYYDQVLDDAAIVSFTRAIELDSSHAEVFFNRANSYGRKGMHEAAISDYTKVLRIDPGNERALFNRAAGYTITGQYDLAILDLNDLLELQPGNNQARYARAVAFFNKGAYQDAKKDVNILLRDKVPVDPSFVEAVDRSIQSK